jgi:hypothetical protein
MIVVEAASNSKTGKAALVQDAGNLPHAVDAQLFAALIWRGKENLNANVGSNRRAPRASDERSIERDITCKATFRMLATVTPVEDHRKAQFISHGCPTLRAGLDGWHRAGLHSEASVGVLEMPRKTALV